VKRQQIEIVIGVDVSSSEPSAHSLTVGSCHQHPSHCWGCNCCCCRMGNQSWLRHLRPGTQHCAKFHRMNRKHCRMAHGPRSTLNRKFVHTGMQCCKCFGISTHLHTAKT
jgi:hypothetical protein